MVLFKTPYHYGFLPTHVQCPLPPCGYGVQGERQTKELTGYPGYSFTPFETILYAGHCPPISPVFTGYCTIECSLCGLLIPAMIPFEIYI